MCAAAGLRGIVGFLCSAVVFGRSISAFVKVLVKRCSVQYFYRMTDPGGLYTSLEFLGISCVLWRELI